MKGALRTAAPSRDGEGARYALLLRDFLRADADARDAWAALKSRMASHVDDLAPYGQIKGAALPLLMRGAEHWAVETAWARRHASASEQRRLGSLLSPEQSGMTATP